MTHRAEQIVDRVVTILTNAQVDKASMHRVQDYDSELELPAVSVKFGPDQPPAISNIPIIDSVLTVIIEAKVSAATEVEVISLLMELRTQCHIALMADRTLGLAFVSDCRYGGADAPELDKTGEKIVGTQECSWLVPYRMNLADPS